jgi:hypothetical protein
MLVPEIGEPVAGIHDDKLPASRYSTSYWVALLSAAFHETVSDFVGFVAVLVADRLSGGARGVIAGWG